MGRLLAASLVLWIVVASARTDLPVFATAGSLDGPDLVAGLAWAFGLVGLSRVAPDVVSWFRPEWGADTAPGDLLAVLLLVASMATSLRQVFG